MKSLFGPLLLLLVGCQDVVKLNLPNSRTTAVSIQSSSVGQGRLFISGENLTSITSASPTSANLAGYKMEIESVSSDKAILKLTHPTSSVLNFAFGTVLTFIVSTAQGDTTINLTVDAAPTGAVMAFNLASCPAGWSAMDGTGGRPDARGRTLVGTGTGAGLTNRTLASVGGAETHVLTVAQMPSHNHAATIKALSDEGNRAIPTGAYIAAPTLTPGNFSTIWDDKLAADSVEVSNEGSGAAHPIMQPYVALLYCQKN